MTSLWKMTSPLSKSLKQLDRISKEETPFLKEGRPIGLKRRNHLSPHLGSLVFTRKSKV
jgi:hypothetical protein